MSVYKDEKTGKWRTVFRYKDWTGKVVQKQKRGFKTRREAVQWEADYLSRVAGDLEMKMKDFVQIYKEERFIRLKAVTVEQKNNVISTKILPYFGEMPLNAITSRDVIKWQNELLAYRDSEGKAYSQSYLKKLHAELSAIFNYAKRYYNLQTNPAANAGSFGSENEIQMSSIFDYVPKRLKHLPWFFPGLLLCLGLCPKPCPSPGRRGNSHCCSGDIRITRVTPSRAARMLCIQRTVP